MTDFSQPHTLNAAPPYTDKDRKKAFVENLKGTRYVKVLPVCEGATFTICNTATAEIYSVAKLSNTWALWGTDRLRTFSSVELENFITEQAKAVTKIGKELRISDEYGCLEWHE